MQKRKSAHMVNSIISSLILVSMFITNVGMVSAAPNQLETFVSPPEMVESRQWGRPADVEKITQGEDPPPDIEPPDSFDEPAVAFTSCEDVTELPQAECEALVAIFNSTDGPNWNNKTGWLQNDSPCSTPWHGVTCLDGHVNQLLLYNNQLIGSLPPEMGNMSSLSTLLINNNSLSGSIPSELGNLTLLIYWHL